MPRGSGTRCHGFLSEDGRFAHCSRDEHAGGLPLDDAQTYAHLLSGPCRCGETHVPAPAVNSPAPARRRDRVLQDADFQRCPSPYPCDYRDDNGDVLYRVARWQREDGSKSYSVHRPDGRGGWLPGRGDARRVLYHAKVVREGIARGEAIHVAEGERKAFLLLERRFHATCNDGGAGKCTAAHAEALREAKRVVVWGDNDEPGRRHVDQVCRLLREAGIEDVRVPVLDVAEGRGLDDWLAGQDWEQSIEAVRALVEAAPQWQPTAPPAPSREVGERVAGSERVHVSDVVPLPVEWLWQGRVPLGMLTTLDGDPGLGKSTVTLDLAARLSRGNVMPDGTPGPAAAGVVLLSAEDDLARVIRPRLEAAGADLRRIVTVAMLDGGERRDPLIAAEDLAEVERHVLETGARLVVWDPLMAYLPLEVNSHRDQDVRLALRRLSVMGERTGAAVLVVRHLNKGSGGPALYRGGGSIGIIGAARSGLLLTADPDDAAGEVRVLAPLKSNLSALAPALRLRLVVDGAASHPRVQWEGACDHTAERLLSAASNPEERLARDEAAEFLRRILADGPVLVREVEREARAEGISERTLNRARKQVGVQAEKVGQPGDNKQEWWLSLPCGWPGDAHDAPKGATRGAMKGANPGSVAPFGQVAGASGCVEPTPPKAATTPGVGSLRESEVAVFSDEAPCPFCGGRVLTWSHGRVCSGCHRRLGAVPEKSDVKAKDRVALLTRYGWEPPGGSDA